MQLLVDGNRVIEAAPNIIWGVFDEPIEKWALLNEQGEVYLYVLDAGYTLVDGVELPEDYEDGKYIFENGEFILNEDWQPYISTEERIANLESENERFTKENLDSIEIEAELLYEVSALQLGLV